MMMHCKSTLNDLGVLVNTPTAVVEQDLGMEAKGQRGKKGATGQQNRVQLVPIIMPCETTFVVLVNSN
jgi:hypothetical protein